MEEELDAIRSAIGQLVERLDDLVYETLRQQLHGEDAKAAEKRLSRARNALRRAEGLLTAERSFDGE